MFTAIRTQPEKNQNKYDSCRYIAKIIDIDSVYPIEYIPFSPITGFPIKEEFPTSPFLYRLELPYTDYKCFENTIYFNPFARDSEAIRCIVLSIYRNAVSAKAMDLNVNETYDNLYHDFIS